MNNPFTYEFLSSLLLLSVPVLPLLLMLPFIRKNLAWFYYIALIPASIVVVMPATLSTEVPWILLGLGLELSNETRLILASAIIMWATAGFLLFKNQSKPLQDSFFSSFFLLTMAGSLGAILATDLISFFLFSTLMGYGFYAMLMAKSDKKTRNITQNAGRVYLAMMIVADLILFEVMLIAALSADSMNFSEVHQTIVQSDYSTLYLALVIISFTIKAGVFPMHFWLTRAFRQVSFRMGLLFFGIPVFIGMLAMLRWLPLGEISSPIFGFTLVAIGLATLVYAVIMMVIEKRQQTPIKLLFFHSLLLANSFIIISMGIGLVDARIWDIYDNAIYYVLASIGLATTALLFITRNLQSYNETVYNDTHPSRVVTWPNNAFAWLGNTSSNLRDSLNTWIDNKVERIVSVGDSWQNYTQSYQKTLQTWPAIISILILLFATIIIIMLLNQFIS